MVEAFVFIIAGAVILAGALGVILNSNPVHSALSLVATLFGVATLFVALEANFLAAVQVIVYAGAIVVMFLFVIMLLGTDQSEDLSLDPLLGQRIAAIVFSIVMAGGLIWILSTSAITGRKPSTGNFRIDGSDVEQIGRMLFSEHLFAFEVTSLLLVVAVVGAVVLSRTVAGPQIDDDEPVAEMSSSSKVGEDR